MTKILDKIRLFWIHLNTEWTDKDYKLECKSFYMSSQYTLHTIVKK
jgi:hypothetical protein